MDSNKKPDSETVRLDTILNMRATGSLGDEVLEDLSAEDKSLAELIRKKDEEETEGDTK